MKLYEARDTEGRLLLRYNYVKHNMLPVGFAESHMRYYNIFSGKPIISSTYRYWIR